MIPNALNLSHNSSAPLRVAANREKTRRNQSIVSRGVSPQPPIVLTAPPPAAFPTSSDIPRIIVGTFVILLAIACGLVVALVLGVSLGFIRIGFC